VQHVRRQWQYGRRAADLGPDPQNQSRFRVQSPPPPFTIHAIVGNSFVPAGTGTSVADGFYVLIKPLTPARTICCSAALSPSITGAPS
jgi:hypothetical protein